MAAPIALVAIGAAACAWWATDAPPAGGPRPVEAATSDDGALTPAGGAAAAGSGAATATGAAVPPDRGPSPVDFAADVRPILEARCMPCHFAGGKMYAELPFDQPVTIYLLGEKLFTRVREPAEQETIRAFLAQQAAPPPSASTATPPPPAG